MDEKILLFSSNHFSDVAEPLRARESINHSETNKPKWY
jgi:hypothetical protein